MDVFKLAFETTVVGLLTISWLAFATYLLFPHIRLDSAGQSLADFLQKNPTALGVGILTLAYCLGSAVLPVANQLVNDEHWPLNERAIRCQVFTEDGVNLRSVHETLPKSKTFLLKGTPCHCSYWAPIFTDEHIPLRQRAKRFSRRWVGLPPENEDPLPTKDPNVLEGYCNNRRSTGCDEFKAKRILTLFQLEETAVLSQPAESTEDLRQLHERIVVLRGTVFSGFILSLICLFAYFARGNGSSRWIRSACGVSLAVVFMIFAAFNGYQDLKSRNVFDIPVLESLLVVVTIFGVALAIMKAANTRFHSKRYVLIALFFTALAYGGWMWSEIIYDQQVISSFTVLQDGPPAANE